MDKNKPDSTKKGNCVHVQYRVVKIKTRTIRLVGI